MGQPVNVKRGFFPIVMGDDVSIRQAGGMAFISRGDTELSQGGGQVILAGGATSIHQGGANLLASVGGVSISQGGAVVAAAGSIRVEQSYVGVALAPGIDISDSRILLGPREAVLFGAVAGVAAAVVTRLLRN